MGEPWMAMAADQDTPGLPSVLVAQAERAERIERKQEQEKLDAKRAEAEDRHEARLHHWMLTRAQQLSMQGRPFDMNDPATLIVSPDEQATEVHDSWDNEAARAETRLAIREGRLHVIDVPASEMGAPPPDPEQLAEEKADRELERARWRTDHARIVAKIRRCLGRKGAGS